MNYVVCLAINFQIVWVCALSFFCPLVFTWVLKSLKTFIFLLAMMVAEISSMVRSRGRRGQSYGCQSTIIHGTAGEPQRRQSTWFDAAWRHLGAPQLGWRKPGQWSCTFHFEGTWLGNSTSSGWRRQTLTKHVKNTHEKVRKSIKTTLKIYDFLVHNCF